MIVMPPFSGMIGPSGTGGGEPEPPVISGLLAWWRSTAIAGLSNNDPITTWPSSTGTPNDLTETTHPPLYKTGILNGYPAAFFSGADNQILKSTNNITGLKHVFVVAYYDDATFFDYLGLLSFFASVLSDSHLIFTGHQGTTHWYYGGAGAGSDFRDSYKLNGTLDTAMTGPMQEFAVIENSNDWSAVNAKLIFGSDRDSGIRFWEGYLLEMFGYDHELSSGDATDLRQYCYDKYNLTGT